MTDPLRCLRTATIIVGVWSIIYALIQCAVMGWQVEVVKQHQAYWENRELPATGAIDGIQARFPGLYAIYTETPERRRVNAMYAIVLIDIILSILHFFFSIAMLYGAVKMVHDMVWPWFFTALPLSIMSTVYAVLWWAGDVFNEQLTMSVAEFALSLAINGVCIAIVAFYVARVRGAIRSMKPSDAFSPREKHSGGVAAWRADWGAAPPPALARKLRRRSTERARRARKRDAEEAERRAREQRRQRREQRKQQLPTAAGHYQQPFYFEQARMVQQPQLLPATFAPAFPWRAPTPPPIESIELPMARPRRKRTAAEIIENLYYEHYPEEIPKEVGGLRSERHRIY